MADGSPPSVPSKHSTVEHPAGRALIGHVATTTTSVADNDTNAITADVTWLVAGAAYDVTEWPTMDL